MLVRIHDRVEDSNQFLDSELAGAPRVHEFTIAASDIIVAGSVVGMHRVDRFPAGAEADLPPRQAQHLVDLGLAESI